MAVQQLVGFRLNPGGREAMLSLLGESKRAAQAAGAAVRVSSLTVGQGTSVIVVTSSFDNWEAMAAYGDATADARPTQPVRDALAEANPPATVLGRFHRSELLARDGVPADTPFLSGLSWDVTGNRPAVIAAAAEQRDMFESLGSSSRLWAVATGEDVGRIVITSAFDGEPSYLRFRAALEARVAGGAPGVMASVATDVQVAGIVHTAALDV